MRYITFDESRPCDSVLLEWIVIGFNPLNYYKTLTKSEIYRKYVGDSPANIAMGAFRLGMECGFLARVSDDRFGEFVAEFLEKEGIDTPRTRKCGSGESPGLTFTEILSHDENNVLMYHSGITGLSLLPKDTDEEYVSQMKAVPISGTALAASPFRGATLKTVALAKKCEVKVIFDIDHRAYNWKGEDEVAVCYLAVIRDNDIILGSREEHDLTERLPGLDGTDETSAKYRCGRQTSIVVIKHGKQDSTVYMKDGKSYSVKPFPVDAPKGLGGGDGYASSFLYGVYRGLEMTDCLELGSASASMLVTSHGCGPDVPVLKGPQAFMKREKETYGEMVARVEQGDRVG